MREHFQAHFMKPAIPWQRHCKKKKKKKNTRQRYFKKRKLSSSTPDECWCKNPRQATTKLNSIIYFKNSTPWPNEIHGMQSWLSIWKSINITYHIKRMKDKNHMIVLIDAEKNIWQNSTAFHDEGIQQTRKRRKLPQHDENHRWKPTAIFILSDKKNWKLSPLRLGKRQGCLLTASIQHGTRSPNQSS